jgi:hypothetical protein
MAWQPLLLIVSVVGGLVGRKIFTPTGNHVFYFAVADSARMPAKSSVRWGKLSLSMYSRGL